MKGAKNLLVNVLVVIGIMALVNRINFLKKIVYGG